MQDDLRCQCPWGQGLPKAGRSLLTPLRRILLAILWHSVTIFDMVECLHPKKNVKGTVWLPTEGILAKIGRDKTLHALKKASLTSELARAYQYLGWMKKQVRGNRAVPANQGG
eukprot:1138493-Pelagomonas_calceolata.AAC.1